MYWQQENYLKSFMWSAIPFASEALREGASEEVKRASEAFGKASEAFGRASEELGRVSEAAARDGRVSAVVGRGSTVRLKSLLPTDQPNHLNQPTQRG